MRKILAFTVLTFMFCAGFSQQDTILRSKKGREILPQKGDFAVGMSVNNLFNYLGNLFSSSGNNYLWLNLLDGNSIFGKYYLSSKTALRLKIGITQTNSHYENKVSSDLVSNAFVTDKLNTSNSGIKIVGGYEKRKGSNRLQVSYGGELETGYSSNSLKYSYGNHFSSANTSPTSTYNFYSPISGPDSRRPAESRQSSGMLIGARIFTGIEYFFLPKISVGGEIGLGFHYHFNGRNISNYESWDFPNNSVYYETNKSNFNSTNLSTDILNGQIFILFHFR